MGGKSEFIEDDATGEETISVLKRVRDLVLVVNGNTAGSIGLHSAVYFYSQDGRFKSSAFLGMIKFVAELIKRKKLNDFTAARKRFESFLLEYDFLAQQINRKLRTADRSYPYISKFFQLVMEGVLSGLTDSKIVSSIKRESDFVYLTTVRPKLTSDRPSTKFDADTKSEVYIRATLSSVPRCGICGGYVHVNSISIDHRKRRRDGGLATVANGQLSHHYCNTGFKN